jgi:translation initiation factor IF-1
MRMKTLALCLTPIMILARPPVTPAQEANAPSREWAAVMAVAPDEKLEVKLKNGKTVKGKLSGVTDTRLTLRRGSKTVDVNREDVSKVYKAGGKSGVSPTLIGAGVGAGVGAVAGGMVDHEAGETPQDIAFLALVGAGIGAVTGFLTGKARKNKVLIYESP